MKGKDKVTLDAIIAKIEKEHGKGALLVLDENAIQATPVISTGSISLDLALGVGGLPRGRIIEIYGPESSGKTTVALHAIAEVQKQGGSAAFIDVEHALDIKYASALGVKTKELLVSQPDYGEQALDIARDLIASGQIDLIVIDSVAALVPKAELEGDVEDSSMGVQARMMGKALRMITGLANKTNTTVIFINQLRMKLGVMFGNPETTSGGNALKYYASCRLDVRRTGTNKDGEIATSNSVRVKIVKNKVAPPFKEAVFDIRFGTGIDRLGEVITLGIQNGIISKGGAWLSFDNQKWQGETRLREALVSNTALCQRLESLIFKKEAVVDLTVPLQDDSDAIEE